MTSKRGVQAASLGGRRARVETDLPAGLFHPSDLDPSNTTAFVGNVTEGVTEADLNQVFRRCGEIASIKLLRAKGCAFVTYAERASAERAIVELHGKVCALLDRRVAWGLPPTPTLQSGCLGALQMARLDTCAGHQKLRHSIVLGPPQ